MNAVRMAPSVACITVATCLVSSATPLLWSPLARCSPPPHIADPANASLGIAPDFVRQDLAGHPVRFSSYRGKLVLLTFWASWCVPCRAEAPIFSAWQLKYHARGLQIIGVAMDDDPAAASAFAAALKLTYPNVIGDAELGRVYGGVLGLPTAFLIDPTGRIVARYRGEVDFRRVEADIKRLLPDSQS
jgi:thiol-disulfide isomerase/thioredoxin